MKNWIPYFPKVTFISFQLFISFFILYELARANGWLGYFSVSTHSNYIILFLLSVFDFSEFAFNFQFTLLYYRWKSLRKRPLCKGAVSEQQMNLFTLSVGAWLYYCNPRIEITMSNEEKQDKGSSERTRQLSESAEEKSGKRYNLNRRKFRNCFYCFNRWKFIVQATNFEYQQWSTFFADPGCRERIASSFRFIGRSNGSYSRHNEYGNRARNSHK